MTRIIDFDALGARAGRCSVPVKRGKVTAVGETVIEAVLPGSRIGMRVSIERPGQSRAMAEVASCDGSRVKLLSLSRTIGIGPGDPVLTLSSEDTIPSGEALLGRIIDPLGTPVDGGPSLEDLSPWSVDRAAPDPLARIPVNKQLVTGIRVIDGCLSLGLGQRIGLFAGPGLGKSMLLGSLARSAECDVSVICLVGERGREVKEFIDRSLGPGGLAQSVIVLAPPDSPPLVRAKALEAATAVAEWFRAAGKHVLLLVDSLTRAVRARRDVALALGEAPARDGYPASAFASLPSVLERAGCDASGSITAVYTVLTEREEGDPVAEEARSLLDGHIVLSSKLAGAGHWPAIDIVRSVSRVMDSVVAPAHLRAARNLRRLLGAYAEHEDLIMMGAYRQGASPDTDLALDRKTEIASFTRQEDSEPSSIESTLKTLFLLTRDL
ncbi:MAG: FliI/YscN family ATPase [Deltaproteobacteria bacterium]|nr:FliI/YscN family ATPase [Deltaproteobacteria bacterium]